MDIERLTEEQRRNIFLVVKEACHNVIKHAGATRAEIVLITDAHQLIIKIIDDGNGFDTAIVGPLSNGLGNMRNRMQQLGGQFQLKTIPGAGTTITLITSFNDRRTEG